MKRRKKLNGRTHLRPIIERKRAKVVKFARRHGSVTNAQATELLGTEQAYYHLAQLAEMGLLKHVGWNLWKPGRKKGAGLRL